MAYRSDKCGIVISCENVKEAQTVSNSYPSVFPDYTFTAIPYNIAPLNFEVKGAQEIRADFAVKVSIF